MKNPFSWEQDRIIEVATQRAERINEYADCDVIAEALDQLHHASTTDDARNALAYLLVAVEYRKGASEAFARSLSAFNATITA